MATVDVPVHQRPTSCHVCGSAPRAEGERPACSHDWTNAEAFAEARAHDARTVVRSQEAAYVAEYRPY
jgi:hypothetical protein